MNPIEPSWNRLARLAAQAPDPDANLPFGFATRAVAAWKAAPAESFFNALEGLTWRGLAVAVGVLGCCAAVGYESVVSVLSGDAALPANLLDQFLGR